MPDAIALPATAGYPSTKSKRQCEAAIGVPLQAYMVNAHAAGLTQGEIAEKIGVKPPVISYWASKLGLHFPRGKVRLWHFRGVDASQKEHCERFGLKQSSVYSWARRRKVSFLVALEEKIARQGTAS